MDKIRNFIAPKPNDSTIPTVTPAKSGKSEKPGEQSLFKRTVQNVKDGTRMQAGVSRPNDNQGYIVKGVPLGSKSTRDLYIGTSAQNKGKAYSSVSAGVDSTGENYSEESVEHYDYRPDKEQKFAGILEEAKAGKNLTGPGNALQQIREMAEYKGKFGRVQHDKGELFAYSAILAHEAQQPGVKDNPEYHSFLCQAAAALNVLACEGIHAYNEALLDWVPNLADKPSPVLGSAIASFNKNLGDISKLMNVSKLNFDGPDGNNAKVLTAAIDLCAITRNNLQTERERMVHLASSNPADKATVEIALTTMDDQISNVEEKLNALLGIIGHEDRSAEGQNPLSATEKGHIAAHLDSVQASLKNYLTAFKTLTGQLKAESKNGNLESKLQSAVDRLSLKSMLMFGATLVGGVSIALLGVASIAVGLGIPFAIGFGLLGAGDDNSRNWIDGAYCAPSRRSRV